MNIKYKDYTIELIEETNSLNPTDNSYKYDNVISDGGTSDCSSKYGILIKDSTGKITRNCLLIGTSGCGQSLCKESCLISEDNLYICVSNKVFSLSLKVFQLNWYKEVDFATAFGIYKLNDDFIIHGELYITRINKNGEIIWQHSSSDIFVSPNPKNFPTDNFYIKENMIFAKSWDERKYCISYDGKMTKSDVMQTENR